MAIGTVYGNTLSDLMAAKNAAQGIDYSRANAQDEISAKRLEAFTRLQAQKLALQQQQNELAQNRALRMQELLQQNQQFGTREANTMTLADKEAASRLAVANAMAKGMDPRAFNTIVDADRYNKEGQARVVEANRLSQARRSALAEIKAAKAYNYVFPSGEEYGAFKTQTGREPDLKAATDALALIDARAKELQFSPTEDGGFYVAPFVPIEIPNTGRTPLIPSVPSAGQSQVPAMLQGGAVTFGGEPLFPSPGLGAPAVDALAPATVVPTLKWNGNNWVQ